MADNKEEHLDNPVNNQPEIPADQIISPTESETINPNQETENMEVHHHAHHEGKKNWKFYFWEFLMLFLAVFCGFLAEYNLEHKLEKDRIKEYSESFVSSLSLDTTQLQLTSYAKENREQKLDSLILLLSDTVKILNEQKIYYYSKYLFRDFPYHTQDAVFQQVRNSGGLRYIKNKKLLEDMTNYYTMSVWLENDFNHYQTRRQFNAEALKITSQIFNSSDYYKLMRDTMVYYNEEVIFPKTNIKLLTFDKKILNQLSALAILAIEDSRDFRHMANFIVEPQAKQLIIQLKKEYKLEK